MGRKKKEVMAETVVEIAGDAIEGAIETYDEFDEAAVDMIQEIGETIGNIAEDVTQNSDAVVDATGNAIEGALEGADDIPALAIVAVIAGAAAIIGLVFFLLRKIFKANK